MNWAGAHQSARSDCSPVRAVLPVSSLMLALWLALATLAGCETETRVLRYKPFFTGLEGATFGEAPVLDHPSVRPEDPTAAGKEPKLIIEHPDGSVTLVSRSPRHVMTHLEHWLDADEDDVLLEQVLAEETKEHFRSQGKDPMVYIKQLHQDRRDIAAFFARIPQAEHTPTVLLDQPGNKTWIIRLVGAPAQGLRFTKLWVKQEQGQWRLLWLS